VANSRQSLKRARQASKRNERNVPQRSKARSYLKKTYNAVNEGNAEEAKKSFSMLVSNVDKLANKGLIHKNKAARHKRRLNKQIKQL